MTIKTITQNTVSKLFVLVFVATAGLFAFGGAAYADNGGNGNGNGQTPPGQEKDHNEKPCKDAFREVHNQGQSCQVEGGLWKVKLRDGSHVLTHGPDAPEFSGRSGVISPNAVPRQPLCGGTDYLRAIIAVPSDVAGDKTVDGFRQDINAVNGVFYHAAVESGSPNGAHFRFLCDTAGKVRVDVVRLATSSAADSWSTIISDLKALGYNRTNEKYVVHYDARMAPCGQGSIDTNSTDSAANPNNVGPDWAINYDCGFDTLLHEIGHNLGAVQPGAPYATGLANGNGWHCWESLDTMCYNDGGNTDPGYIKSNCPDFDHFDCNHDTYFDAKIGAGQGGVAGSYIDRNWNIGECYVKFVINYACAADTTKPAVTAPAAAFVDGSTLNLATGVPANGMSTRLSWSGSDASGIAKFELQRFGLSPIGAVTWTDEPLSSAIATSKVLSLAPGSYTFRVRAQDRAGNWSDFVSTTFTAELKQENAGTITGYWYSHARSSASGGGIWYSTAAGASYSMTFTGRQVAWVASKGVDRGRAHVYLDGAFVKTVDLYSASTAERQVIFSKGFTTSATHTVKIVVEGTAGRPYVTVDAFQIVK
jgi:hypothetical protein